MLINKELLNNLTEQAKVNPRLRQHYDLRASENDTSQRILNAIEQGPVIFECKNGKYDPEGMEIRQ